MHVILAQCLTIVSKSDGEGFVALCDQTAHRNVASATPYRHSEEPIQQLWLHSIYFLQNTHCGDSQSFVEDQVLNGVSHCKILRQHSSPQCNWLGVQNHGTKKGTEADRRSNDLQGYIRWLIHHREGMNWRRKRGFIQLFSARLLQ